MELLTVTLNEFFISSLIGIVNIKINRNTFCWGGKRQSDSLNQEICNKHRLDDRGFESRQGLGIFLFTTAFRPALGPTQPTIPGALSLGVKRSGREAPSSAEVKECMELDLVFPNTPVWRGAQLSKVQRQLYDFLLTLVTLY
jgi:hypothetical protein